MRYSRSFHSEWGCFAPAPSFMRTVRVALVSAMIGATAGAVVVASLVQRPDDDISFARRVLANRTPVITSPAAAASLAGNPARQKHPPPAVTSASISAQASASTASSVVSADTPGGMASPTTAPAPATPLSKVPSTAVATATPVAASAVIPEPALSTKGTVRKRHWHPVNDARKHWRHDRKLRPSFQSPDRFPFAQSDFSLTRDKW